jgi:hypothetical protein
MLVAATALIVSCNSGSPKEKLIGTWKLRDIANTGDSIIETATFSKSNSLLLKTTINGKIADTTICSYELSPDKKYLISKIDTSTYRFEIIKITKEVLELRPVEKMNVAHYIRYEN